MKQHKDDIFFVKTRTKTKGNTVTKEVPIDIFEIRNEKGEKLGDILKGYEKSIEMLQSVKDKIQPLMNYVEKHKNIFGGPKK